MLIKLLAEKYAHQSFVEPGMDFQRNGNDLLYLPPYFPSIPSNLLFPRTSMHEFLLLFEKNLQFIQKPIPGPSSLYCRQQISRFSASVLHLPRIFHKFQLIFSGICDNCCPEEHHHYQINKN